LAPRASFAPRLVIMVKEPVAGRVKTRLARGIGTVAATAVYRAMLLSVVARLGSDPRWQTVLAVSPDVALASSMLPDIRARVPQGGGDLGQRLQRIFDELDPGPVVVIGTDIPAIKPSDIADAFQALGSHDAVFGPSCDGGYWLIGIKRRPRLVRAFDTVRWSSEHALTDTAANLKGLRVAHLRLLDDVDTADDFALQKIYIGRRVLPASELKS
jgi:uncharacterized protein